MSSNMPTKRLPKSSKFLIYFGLAWILISTPLLLFAWSEWNTLIKFQQASEKTTAKITGKRKEDRKDSDKNTVTDYYIKYRFEPKNSPAIEQESSLTQEEWKDIYEGSVVDIEYLPEDPRISSIAGSRSQVGAYLTSILGLVMFVIGVSCFGVGLKKSLLESRLRRNGIEAFGTVKRVKTGSLQINGVWQVKVEYSFKDRMGRSFEGETRHLDPSITNGISGGSACQIRYDKDRPEHNILVSL